MVRFPARLLAHGRLLACVLIVVFMTSVPLLAASTVVSVDSNDCSWQSTGIQIEPGDLIEFSASGDVVYWMSDQSWTKSVSSTTSSWQSTGIDIEVGDELEISASGQVRYWQGTENTSKQVSSTTCAWQSTGISVTAGEQIQFTASGLVRHWQGSQSWTRYVAATDCSWQSTGISVSAGDTLVFSASGQVVYWKGTGGTPVEYCGPEGSGPGACDDPSESCCLAPGLANNALVGKIGSGSPFYIGTSRTVSVVSGSGTLYLGMNETAYCGGCDDNEGAWIVNVDRIQESYCGPDGSSPGACDDPSETCCLAPGLDNCALVGKVGSGTPFLIGSSRTVTAGSSGTLYLGMNETAYCGGCADNEGSWSVTIGTPKEQYCGPEGSGPGACDVPGETCCLAPGLDNNALVGRIGTGDPFLIGSSYYDTATEAGTLYLGMNETVYCGGCADNEGSWTASISRHREARCGPEGSGPGACDSTSESCCLAPGLGNNALVGKIGDGSPFRIGSGTTILAEEAGLLSLGMNETAYCGGCADNYDEWMVTVDIGNSCAADVTPPQVELDCGPVTCQDDGGVVTLTWEASDNCTAAGLLDFWYQLDEEPWSEEFRDSQLVLDGLGTGYHSLQLSVEDESGNAALGTCEFLITCPPERTGQLRVEIEPEEARDDGALWRVTSGPDTTWQSSGQTLELPPGEYVVTFMPLRGWSEPVERPRSISSVGSSGLTVTYERTLPDALGACAGDTLEILRSHPLPPVDPNVRTVTVDTGEGYGRQYSVRVVTPEYLAWLESEDLLAVDVRDNDDVIMLADLSGDPIVDPRILREATFVYSGALLGVQSDMTDHYETIAGSIGATQAKHALQGVIAWSAETVGTFATALGTTIVAIGTGPALVGAAAAGVQTVFSKIVDLVIDQHNSPRDVLRGLTADVLQAMKSACEKAGGAKDYIWWSDERSVEQFSALTWSRSWSELMNLDATAWSTYAMEVGGGILEGATFGLIGAGAEKVGLDLDVTTAQWLVDGGTDYTEGRQFDEIMAEIEKAIENTSSGRLGYASSPFESSSFEMD